MAIWAEIKKAINSTLGTSSFKSLDSLISDNIESAKNNLSSTLSTNITNAQNNVNTNVNTIKTYTATNNTASATGILSQKMSYLITQRRASLTGVGETVFTYDLPSQSSNPAANSPYVIAKFIAPVAGRYKVTASGGFYRPLFKTTISRGLTVSRYYDGSKVARCTSGGIDPCYMYSQASIGTCYSKWIDVSWDLNMTTNACIFESPTMIITSFRTEAYFYCEAGEPVVLFVCEPNKSGTTNYSESTITVTYQGL